MAIAGSQTSLPVMTAAEFMDWDGGGHVGKLELVNGSVCAHAINTADHALIEGNLVGLIGAHVRITGLTFRVGIRAPVQPQMHANDNVRAPDLAVTCAPPGKSKIFPDPVLIIEVLSPGNQKETWDSIYAMATIPALTEIAVVDSEKVRVEVFRRGADGGWPKGGEVFEASGTVRLESIGAEFAISDIYGGTHLG